MIGARTLFCIKCWPLVSRSTWRASRRGTRRRPRSQRRRLRGRRIRMPESDHTRETFFKPVLNQQWSVISQNFNLFQISSCHIVVPVASIRTFRSYYSSVLIFNIYVSRISMLLESNKIHSEHLCLLCKFKGYRNILASMQCIHNWSFDSKAVNTWYDIMILMVLHTTYILLKSPSSN